MQGYNKLLEKHPPGSLDSVTLQEPNNTGRFAVSDSDVRKSVLSLPAGSAGGLDGLRPQHSRDLLRCPEADLDFLTSLTVCQSSFSWTMPQGDCPVFFCGRLIGLKKKDGCIPIAIRFTPRRLFPSAPAAWLSH